MIMISTEELLAKLRLHKDRLVSEYGVTKIGLFGSFARGEAAEDSDVDIAVETDSHDPFLLIDLQEEMERILSRKVDLVSLKNNFRPLFRRRLERDWINV